MHKVGIEENGKVLLDSKNLKKVPFLKSCRAQLALNMFFGMLFVYLLRINLSVAIVCMVKSGPDQLQMTANSTENDKSYDVMPTSPADNSTRKCGVLQETKGDNRGEFEWSRQMQGLVLSSFFYGYMITQIPGGWLASKYGGKHVFSVAALITIVTTVLLPVAARSSVYIVLAMRIVMGLAAGVFFPCTHSLWGKWAPVQERGKLIAFSYAGTMIGTIMAMGLSGVLCSIEFDNGWPLIFYIFGGACFLWWITWNFIVYNSPNVHPRIAEAERREITDAIGPSAYKQDVKVPWKKIMTSPAVLAIIVAHFCNNWGSYTILTCTPMYMKDVLKFDIKKSGMLAAVPYAAMFVASILFGQLADTLIGRNILTTAKVRKLWQCLSFLPAAAFIIGMGYFDCTKSTMAVACLTMCVMFTAFGRSGFTCNHVDIAPRFSGLLYGISNTFATIPGIISPTIAGALTPNGTKEEWQRVFFITGAVYATGAIVFGLLARGVEQPWAKVATLDSNPDQDDYKDAKTDASA